MKQNQLYEVLKEFTLEDALLLETFDRQYKALERLHHALANNELFLKLVVVNALLSYQLPTKGEVYWENFGSFFAKNPSLEEFGEFLKRYNNRFLNSKLKRLQRVLKAVKKLTKEELIRFCKDPKGLLDYLSAQLNQEKTAKTLVFAVKMFIYACRIASGKNITAPFEIEIPLDVRLRKISESLEFWRSLSLKTNIPPLHLDTLIWVTLGADKSFLEKLPIGLKEKVEKLKEVLKELIL
ncbi:MAG: transcriptional regulator [Aquificaceae bacterium]|nr:MAG: transcriptional regulator [Aquificaceae bacterium]